MQSGAPSLSGLRSRSPTKEMIRSVVKKGRTTPHCGQVSQSTNKEGGIKEKGEKFISCIKRGRTLPGERDRDERIFFKIFQKRREWGKHHRLKKEGLALHGPSVSQDEKKNESSTYEQGLGVTYLGSCARKGESRVKNELLPTHIDFVLRKGGLRTKCRET